MSQYLDSGTATLDPFASSSGCEDHAEQAYDAAPALYQASSCTAFDLPEMEPQANSSGPSSQSTSPIHPCSVSEGQTGRSTLTGEPGKVCPLLAGHTFQCNPQLCGPNAACLDFPDIPEIEDYPSIPSRTEEMSNSPPLLQPPQPLPVSIQDEAPFCLSTSPFNTPNKNPEQRQRSKRATCDSRDVKSANKKAHSIVERRYRENLNGNIAQLHEALIRTKRVGYLIRPAQEDGPEPQKVASSRARKSDILREATEYVQQTEVELRHMTDEIMFLNKRVRQLEKLLKCEDCALMKQLVNFNI